MRRFALRLVILLFAVFAAAASIAVTERVVSIRNTTGVWASDLHVTFQFSGGNVFVSPASVVALLCPIPNVPSNGQVTNTVVIDWGVPCVPPGSVVHFIVRSNFGPVQFSSGFWTGPGGVNIGNIPANAVREITPPPPPPPPPPPNWGFWATKIQVRCLAWAPIVKGPWMRPEGQQCWMREICEPFIRYETRLVRCWFVFRKWRLIETGRCRVLTDWEFSHNTLPKYYNEFATIPPHDMGGQIIPINGAPRNGRIVRAGRYMPWMQNLNVRFSDDSGQNYHPSADFISAFFDVFHSLRRVTDEPEGYNSFETHCMYIAQGYFDAWNALEGVIEECDNVLLFEPDPQISQLREEAVNLRQSFFDIFFDLQDGTPQDPLAYDRARAALEGMALAFMSMPETRFHRAAQRMNYMALGFQKARDMVLSGIGVIQNQDDFMFGLENRVLNMAQHVASALMPHITVQCGLGPIGWFSQVIEGVEVMVTNSATGELLDHMIVNMSELGEFDIPIMAYEEGIPIQVRFKVDTYLSQTIEAVTIDGSSYGATLINGDVNGDDCIDLIDLQMVQNAMGTGGMDAGSIGPEDLNFSGMVTPQDLAIVSSGMGFSGNGFKEIRGVLVLGDYEGPALGEMISAELRVPGNPLPIETRNLMLDGGGNFTFTTTQPLGTYELAVKGRTWLRKATLLALTPCGADLPDTTLTNGDVDGDNEVTLVDFGRVSAAFGKLAGEPGYDLDADLNGDGEVNLVDFGIVSAHFGEAGDP